MKIKEITRPILSWMFGAAIIVLTAKGIIPVPAFVAVASVTITWWFKSRDEEKQYARLREDIQRIVDEGRR